jgi:hypothetical protein
MEKFKPGDMVSVTTENSYGVGFVYNTYTEKPEQGILVASIAWSNGGCTGGIPLWDFKTIEKTGVLTEEKGKAIIKELDGFDAGLEKCSLDIPSGVDHTGEMIHIIRMGLIAETVD